MAAIDILIPIYSRPAALAVTLTSLCAQTHRDFRAIISDQTEEFDAIASEEVQAALRVLQAGDRRVVTNDVRPHEQQIEFWERPVEPELVKAGMPAWERWRLHNAANLYHVQQRLHLTPNAPRKYRVAWVASCVLFDRLKLLSVGGFSFWRQLPPHACGEDVLAQLRVMARYGGCGLIPSGVYHQELPTTITDRSLDAPNLLPI